MPPSLTTSATALRHAVACPWCAADLDMPAPGTPAACRRCGKTADVVGTVIAWASPDMKAAGKRRSLWTVALRQFNPLASRLSPLRYFSDWRVEQYYRRTLRDPELARDWGRHYLEELALPPGAAVLDHGCGRGRNTALLTHLGFQVGAQDITSHAWWHKLEKCVFQQVPAAAPRLPWRDRAFALVLDVAVIHYLTTAQLSVLAGEVFRVLQPGGYWVLVEANDQSYGAHAFRRIIGSLHSLDSVRAIVAAAGFHERDVAYEAFYAPVLPIFVNFLRKVARPGPLDLDDYRSTLARRIVADRRGLWRLRLMKPRASG